MADYSAPALSDAEEDDDIDRRLAAAGLPNAFPVTDKPGLGLPSPTRSIYEDAAVGGMAAWHAHMQARQQPIKPGTPPTDPAPVAPAPVQPAAPAAALTASNAIDPDASVDVSVPDLAATAAPAAPATAKLPTIPGTSSTASTDSDPASLLGGGANNADDDARGQYAWDQTATNKYLRSQGAQMEVAPTGLSQPARDKNGNVLFKAQVIDPAFVGQDGDVYRVSRDEYGDHHHFRIADGMAGQDFHEDPQSGEQYVATDGANGASRRTVLGVNGFIPAANALHAVAHDHQSDAEQAGIAISEAQEGIAGVPGHGASSLADLHQQRASLRQQLQPAENFLARAQTHIDQGGSLSPADAAEWDRTSAVVQGTKKQLAPLEGEIAAREDALTQARQQRTASIAAMRAAAGFRDSLSTPEGKMGVKADLGTPLAGGSLDAKRANQLRAAGLVQDDGVGGFVPSEAGKALLTGGRAPRQPVAPAPALAPAAPDAQPGPSSPATARPDATPATAPGPTSPAAAPGDQAPSNPSGQGPAGEEAGQGGQTKPYSVGQDGKLQLDPASIPLGLLAAAHDGIITQDQLAQAMPQAARAQMAIDQSAQHAATNPGLAGQLKAFGGSILQGITEGVGKIVRSPLGQGVAGIVDLADGHSHCHPAAHQPDAFQRVAPRHDRSHGACRRAEGHGLEDGRFRGQRGGACPEGKRPRFPGNPGAENVAFRPAKRYDTGCRWSPSFTRSSCGGRPTERPSLCPRGRRYHGESRACYGKQSSTN